MLNIKIFTLYPKLFPGPLDIGIYKKAKSKKIWSLKVINIRDYSKDKHKTVDDTPYGGGNGMLMRADVLADALDKNIDSKKKENTINMWIVSDNLLRGAALNSIEIAELLIKRING